MNRAHENYENQIKCSKTANMCILFENVEKFVYVKSIKTICENIRRM